MLSHLGNESPDVDVTSLKAMYQTTQQLIAEGLISAGHDVSDGGLAVALLEMAFAGNCGIDVSCSTLVSADIPVAFYTRFYQ